MTKKYQTLLGSPILCVCDLGSAYQPRPSRDSPQFKVGPSQMLHGAGLLPYMTGPFFGVNVGKTKSSTMEHLGMLSKIYEVNGNYPAW